MRFLSHDDAGGGGGGDDGYGNDNDGDDFQYCRYQGVLEVGNQVVSWFITYLADLQPTYIGAIIHLLSSKDIPVGKSADVGFKD